MEEQANKIENRTRRNGYQQDDSCGLGESEIEHYFVFIK